MFARLECCTWIDCTTWQFNWSWRRSSNSNADCRGEENTEVVNVLNDGGFNGNVFKKYASRKSARKEPITKPNSRARQDALVSIKLRSTLHTYKQCYVYWWRLFYLRGTETSRVTHQQSWENERKFKGHHRVEEQGSGADWGIWYKVWEGCLWDEACQAITGNNTESIVSVEASKEGLWGKNKTSWMFGWK